MHSQLRWPCIRCGKAAPSPDAVHDGKLREQSRCAFLAGPCAAIPYACDCDRHRPGVLCLQIGVQSIVFEKSQNARSEGFSVGVATNGWRALDELSVGDSIRAEHLEIEG